MATQLEAIIDGVTDDSMSTANLMLKVKIVGHRLKADDMTQWADFELNGYPDADNLPSYRSKLTTNVRGVWAGPMGARMTQTLTAGLTTNEQAEHLSPRL